MSVTRELQRRLRADQSDPRPPQRARHPLRVRSARSRRRGYLRPQRIEEWRRRLVGLLRLQHDRTPSMSTAGIKAGAEGRTKGGFGRPFFVLVFRYRTSASRESYGLMMRTARDRLLGGNSYDQVSTTGNFLSFGVDFRCGAGDGPGDKPKTRSQGSGGTTQGPRGRHRAPRDRSASITGVAWYGRARTPCGRTRRESSRRGTTLCPRPRPLG
jgi:hypothetical protein